MENFKNTIKEKYVNKNNVVLFFDEAFFKRESSVIRSWYQKGSHQVVKREPSFEKIGVYSCVNPKTGKLFSMMDEYFDSEGVKVYLDLLLKSIKTKKKIFLVLDNAAPHRSKLVKDFIKEHHERI